MKTAMIDQLLLFTAPAHAVELAFSYPSMRAGTLIVVAYIAILVVCAGGRDELAGHYHDQLDDPHNESPFP